MKRWIWTFTIVAALSSFMLGCGSSSDNNNNQDRYGQYDPVTGRYYDNRYNQSYGVNRDAILLSGSIEIKAEHKKAYQKYLKGIGACFGGQTCSWVDNAPGMTLTIDDYKFRGTNSTSRGSVILHTQSRPANYQVAWRLFDGGKGFDSQQTQPYGTPGYNTYLKIKVTGRPTDSTVLVELMYGSNPIGHGYLERINRH